MNTLKVNDTKESSIIFNIMLLVYGFSFFNLRGYGYYVMLISFAMFVIWSVVANVKIKINEEIMVLTSAFFLYTVIYGIHYKFAVYSFVTTALILPVFSYVVGYHIILDAKKPYINEKTIRTVICIVAFMLFAHGAIGVFSTSAEKLDTRLINDVVIGKKDMAATNTAGYLNMMASFLFYSLFMQKGILKKTVLCVCSVVSAYCGILTGTRTTVVIFLAVFFMCLLCKVIFDKENRKANVRILFISLAVIGVVAVLYNINAFDLKTSYEKTSMYKRLSGEIGDVGKSNQDRHNRYGEVFVSIFENPMGMDALKFEYAHNLWLDIGRLTGIFPFFLMIIFSVMSLLNFVRFFFYTKVQMQTKYLFFSVYIAVFLNMFTEPIMEGLPFLCWFYTFMSGMLKSCLDNFEHEQIESVETMKFNLK